MFLLPDKNSIQTESDVEQKLIMPLLTSPVPTGLGFNPATIATKPDIRRFNIGKGKEQKLYYPDYVVAISGLPMVVVEAKAPGEDIYNAYREARLYATELNAAFPSSLNPATKIICSNGDKVVAGNWDEDTPLIEIEYDHLIVSNLDFAKFIDFAKVEVVTRNANGLLGGLTQRPFYRPTKLIGGQSVRNEEIANNEFGRALSLDYRHLFNPTTDEERAYIVNNAYIPSRRRERYIEPIDKIIRVAAPPSETSARLIEDTQNPTEILSVLRRPKLDHQVLLLIGGVGAGKSTFVDYIKEVALPRERKKTPNEIPLSEATLWVRVNMNNAPIDDTKIYNWLCEQLISELRAMHPAIDFDDLDSIQKLYAVELRALKKGALQLFQEGSPDYNSRLADEIIRLQRDLKATANAYARYLCAGRGKLLIIVLDNCDKRIRDQQLLMFQAAQWLQQEFYALIILPLRDETYDNHRNEPPLDTALKDLVFRIEPPLFQSVLSARINLALKEIQGNPSLSYSLPNGMRVEYPASEQAFYLSSILRSIFEYDAFVRGIIVGLAGRDTRKAMEMFIEFCTSGHIGEDEIFRIRQAKGQYSLSFSVIVRVLLRLNRRFYDGDQSYVKNLFSCDPQDARPNYFVRLAILRWLKERFNIKGPTGITGYHPVWRLKSDITPLGVEEEMFHRETLYLLKAGCITAEHLRTDMLSDEDLIRLASSGHVHLDLLGNLAYLAAIAEDMWYDNREVADAIANTIGEARTHYSRISLYKNAKRAVDYLSRKISEPFPAPEAYLQSGEWKKLIDISAAQEAVRREEENDAWLTADERYIVGNEYSGIVEGYNSNIGIFVEMEPHLNGLIPIQRLRGLDKSMISSLSRQKIVVRVDSLDATRNRMGLSLVTDLSSLHIP